MLKNKAGDGLPRSFGGHWSSRIIPGGGLERVPIEVVWELFLR
jgi:hypothetical protein